MPKRADKWRKMFDIQENVDLKEAVMNIIKTGENFKMPKLKITRLDMEKKKEKIMEEKEKRRRNKECVERERVEYEKRYGKILSN